jgi:hypothetical protein
MVQLNILSGKRAGTVCVARHFPFRVGRNADADLSADEPGVWDNHLEFQLCPGEGIRVTAHAEALMTINAERAESAILRNGDVLEAGALKLRFWLSEVQLVSQKLREALTWAALGLLLAAQIAAIYWLV